jgi:hypothetical protein
MVDRRKAIDDEHRESQQRGRAAYTYVKVNELDRMGIEQYKAIPGENFIAVVCNPDQKGFFGKKVVVHNNIGVDNKVFICPKGTYGKECPICEEIMHMKKDGEDQELIDDLRPSTRYLFFVIDFKSQSTEEKGVQWFDASSGIKDEIVSLCHNKRTGDSFDISDPKEGKTVCFERTGTRLKTRYKGFELEGRDPIDEEMLLDLPLFEEILQDVTYEQIEKEFFGTTTRSRDEDRGSRRVRGEEDKGDRGSRRVRGNDDEGDRGSRRGREDENEDTGSRRGRSGDDEGGRSSRRDRENNEDASSRRRGREDNGEDNSRRRGREDDRSSSENDEKKDEPSDKKDEPQGEKKSDGDSKDEAPLSERVKRRQRMREQEGQNDK